VLLLVVATAALWALRDTLDKAHAALIYLLVVLGGSARRGRAVGLFLAVLCFLCFNFFLLPPYYTLAIRDPLDWLVLIVFLITSAVAAHQLYRVQQQAESARARAAEIDRLSTLGAETLNAGRAEDAVQSIAQVVQRTLGMGLCEIFLRQDGGFRRIGLAVREGYRPAGAEGSDELFALLTDEGVAAVSLMDGTTHVTTRAHDLVSVVLASHADARAVAIPLEVRGRGVGIFRLANEAAISLAPPQRRFAEALADYAALGVERVRLVAEAEHAEALREADRLKDALLASVSHDLRTPLTTIKALAHDIRMEGDERAAVVEEEADRLNRFVTDLLDYSHLTGGEVQMELELTAAEDLLGAALQRVSGIARGHEIRTRLAEEDGTMLIGSFDFPHALRILTNLIENACKYSPPTTSVDVSVASEGDRLAFSVADRGPGIPEEERERIFDPFYRTNSIPDVRGSGLGLAIARRLAEAQGGAIRYETRPGGGSIFTLLLPAAELPPLDMPG
jgi:two-component system sensor histidine kinase KdpD